MIRKSLLVISLMFLFGTMGVWLLTYWVRLGASVNIQSKNYRASVGYGFFRFRVWDDPTTIPNLPFAKRIRGPVSDRNLWHFQLFRNSRRRMLDFPAWLLPLPFAIYPTIAFIRGPYRRYRRRKNGLCLKCGYDLTGNVSGICPECGEQI